MDVVVLPRDHWVWYETIAIEIVLHSRLLCVVLARHHTALLLSLDLLRRFVLAVAQLAD